MYIVRWKNFDSKHWCILAKFEAFKTAERFAIQTEMQWRKTFETEGRNIEIKNTKTGDRFTIG